VTEAVLTTPLRSLAERVARALARYDDVAAICLLGSVARGNARPQSDVDLLVLTDHSTLRSRLMRRLPPALRDERLSLLCLSTDRWEHETRRATLFVTHLRLEGQTLYDRDGILKAGLDAAAQQPPDVEGEVRRQLKRLRLYRDLERLNGQHLFVLAHLYAIGKAIAIARCVELGEPIFVKEQALRVIASRRHDLSDAAHTISRLRPFYDLTRGDRSALLPFEHVHAEDEVTRAIGAIERLGLAS
jgi:predicted nucleotidyltransferase